MLSYKTSPESPQIFYHIFDDIRDELSIYDLKHTTTLFPLPNNYILSREWRFIIDLLQINYLRRPMVL